MRVRGESRRAGARCVAMVLAGGRGSRLKHLTDRRAKPAVPFGGKYRIVDFALSNCVNSGIRRVYVATQYKSHSLLRHIQRGWGFMNGEINEFVDLLPAQQRVDESMWYRGTADAVWQNLDILRAEDPEYVLILAGDHIYKMDYSVMLQEHIARGADVSVGCVTVPRRDASDFGVMHVDQSDRITAFLEKPADPPCIPGDPDRSLASMGIYVCNADFLYDVLNRDAIDPTSTHDFGRDFVPSLVSNAKLFAHRFTKSTVGANLGEKAYWRDVGTVDAYWEANIDLTNVTPSLDLYDRSWPIFTYSAQQPPAKCIFDDDDRRGTAIDSVLSGGVIVSGAQVRKSLLSTAVRVNSFAQLEGAVVLPECDIGRHARLHNVVLDRGVRIPEGMVIGEDPEEDSARFHRSEGGVTLVTKAMLDRLDN